MAFYLVMVNATLAAQFSPLFECLYVIEAFICLVILISTPLSVYAVMGMSPLHRNLRLTLSSVVIYFSFSIVARLIMVYYQYYRIPLREYLMELTELQSKRNPFADDDTIFMLANLVREAFYGFIIAMPFALALERCFATLFSSWYEKQSVSTLIVFVMQSLALEAYAWCNSLFLIFEIYSIQFNVISYGIVSSGGALLFQYILTLNVDYNRRLQKMTRTDYCLSRAYQIRENIKIMKMLRKLAFPTMIFNLPAFAFISMYAFLPQEESLEVLRNVAVACFDLWIALYAVSFGLLTYNMEPRLQDSVRRCSYAAYLLDKYDDVTGKIRKLTVRSPPPSQHAETDIYFSMLTKDLYSNANRKHSMLSKLSIIEIW